MGDFISAELCCLNNKSSCYNNTNYDNNHLVSLGREPELRPEVKLDLGRLVGRHSRVVVALQEIVSTQALIWDIRNACRALRLFVKVCLQ